MNLVQLRERLRSLAYDISIRPTRACDFCVFSGDRTDPWEGAKGAFFEREAGFGQQLRSENGATEGGQSVGLEFRDLPLRPVDVQAGDFQYAIAGNRQVDGFVQSQRVRGR